MRLDPKNIPENIRRLMPKEDRKPLGKAGMTNEEAAQKWAAGQERELQNQMAALLRQRGLFFRQMPFGKKTPWKGWPDFIIVLPRKAGQGVCSVLMVEAKAEGGALTEDQEGFHEEFTKLTYDEVLTVWNLAQFKNILDTVIEPDSD